MTSGAGAVWFGYEGSTIEFFGRYLEWHADRNLFAVQVEAVAEVPFTLERRRQPLEVVNRLQQVGPYGA